MLFRKREIRIKLAKERRLKIEKEKNQTKIISYLKKNNNENNENNQEVMLTMAHLKNRDNLIKNWMILSNVELFLNFFSNMILLKSNLNHVNFVLNRSRKIIFRFFIKYVVNNN